MKTHFLQLFSLLLLVFLIQGCDSQDDSSIIAGQVIEQGTGNPISSAVVELTQPENLQQTATTDSTGQFSFDVNPNNETVSVTLEIDKQGYQTGTSSFKLAPNTNVDDLTIELQSADSGGGDGDGGDDEGVGGESGGPAALELTELSSQTINVAGTGGNVNATFTFEVTDSAGRTVDYPVDVDFSIIKGPDGGESITPTTATTGVNSPVGKVKSNLAAGDSSGTVRIKASIERPEVGVTISSSPVLISIASGFPVPENFHVAPEVHNFDAYGYINEDHINAFTASVGDLKGNPVKEGTPVYFSADKSNLNDGGGLINASATTNENGYATVNLSANGSTPSGHPKGPGFIDIIAETIDKNNNYIKEKTTLLLTTRSANITVSPNSMNIANGGSQNFDVTITDQNGYPMAANTNISVTTGQGLTASGDIIDLKLGDYLQAGAGTTNFKITISDEDPDTDNSTQGSFTINVETPSGQVTTKTIGGSRAKSP